MVGNDLIDLVNDRLSGYQNAFDNDAKFRFVNEGKDEVWAILKSLDDDYFVVQSQSTNASNSYYFPPLTNTNRQYTLPPDFREIRFIECITSGYEYAKFTHKYLTDPVYREARKAANAAQQSNSFNAISEYYYTFEGKDQFVMAQWPEAPQMIIVLHYVRNIPDLEMDDSVDEIIAPFAKKIADYAVKKMMLPVQDQAQFTVWAQQWREDVITLASNASPRDQADPQFVQDFLG